LACRNGCPTLRSHFPAPGHPARCEHLWSHSHTPEPMRFLHLADLHLDTSFAGRSAELRSRLREATREALENAVQHALDAQVDAVLIAGDLFDGNRLSFRTERFLTESLGRLTGAGISVVYAAGNHDPGGGSAPASRLDWPSGVTVISGPEPVRVDIHREDRLVGRVTGAGHASPREAEDLSLRFPSPSGDVPEVALLHTQVVGATGSDEHDRYAPSSLDHLRSSGFDYWALGHIHLRQAVSSDPPIHYSGNVQGRHPGEDGPKGGLLVELAPPAAPRIRFVELGPIRWETLVMDDLRDEGSSTGLVDRTDSWTGAPEPGRGGERPTRACLVANGFSAWSWRARLPSTPSSDRRRIAANWLDR